MMISCVFVALVFILVFPTLVATIKASDSAPRGEFIPLRSNHIQSNLMKNFLAMSNSNTSGIDLDTSLTVLYQLVIDVQVGTPPQKVSLVIDSTKVSSFIPSPNCTAQSCTYLKLNPFNKNLSSTYVGTGVDTSMTIGDYVVTIGKVAGEVGEDVIRLEDIEFRAPFLYVNSTVDPIASMLMFHGRIGLGWPLPSGSQDPNTPSWLPEIINRYPRKIWSVWMNEYKDYGVIGGLELGGYDDTIIDHTTLVTFPNFLNSGFWAVRLDSVYVGDLYIGFSGWAILDLASPFTTLPLVSLNIIAEVLDLDTYGTRVRSAQAIADYYKVPCDNAQYMKPLTFIVNGIPVTFGPEDYLIGNGKDCVCIFYGHDIGEPIGSAWIFGNGAFRRRMVIFNYDDNTVSWASLKTG